MIATCHDILPNRQSMKEIDVTVARGYIRDANRRNPFHQTNH
jgi:hypothetical protein